MSRSARTGELVFDRDIEKTARNLKKETQEAKKTVSPSLGTQSGQQTLRLKH